MWLSVQTIFSFPFFYFYKNLFCSIKVTAVLRSEKFLNCPKLLYFVPSIYYPIFSESLPNVYRTLSLPSKIIQNNTLFSEHVRILWDPANLVPNGALESWLCLWSLFTNLLWPTTKVHSLLFGSRSTEREQKNEILFFVWLFLSH